MKKNLILRSCGICGTKFYFIDKHIFSQVLFFEGMASYKNDFTRLFRIHFNQVLRAKRTVHPIVLSRVCLSISVNSSSVKLIQTNCVNNNYKEIENGCQRNKNKSSMEKNHSENEEKYGLTFNFDSLKQCSIQILFGVSLHYLYQMLNISDDSEKNLTVPVESRFRVFNLFRQLFSNRRNVTSEASRALLEMEEIDSMIVSRDSIHLNSLNYVSKTHEYFFNAGINQTFCTKPEDEFFFSSFMEKRDERNVSNDQIIPILIIASVLKGKGKQCKDLDSFSSSEGHSELTVIRRMLNNNGISCIEVVKQICVCSGKLDFIEGFDVYGLEDKNDIDCLICMSNVKDTMLLPCRHSSLCFECLRSLRQEKCPICRATFEAFILFPFKPQFNRTGSPLSPVAAQSVYENEDIYSGSTKNGNSKVYVHLSSSSLSGAAFASYASCSTFPSSSAASTLCLDFPSLSSLATCLLDDSTRNDSATQPRSFLSNYVPDNNSTKGVSSSKEIQRVVAGAPKGGNAKQETKRGRKKKGFKEEEKEEEEEQGDETAAAAVASFEE